MSLSVVLWLSNSNLRCIREVPTVLIGAFGKWGYDEDGGARSMVTRILDNEVDEMMMMILMVMMMMLLMI